MKRPFLSTVFMAALLAAACGTAFAGIAVPNVMAGTPRAAMRHVSVATTTTEVRLAVVLKYRNQAQLDALRTSQSDPASPLYAHWLSAEQFLENFAPSASDYAATVATLQGAGFQIGQTYPNRTVIDVLGPAPVVDRYFQTQIANVQQPGSGLRYANVRPAFLPPALARTVEGVIGFDNLREFQTDHVFADRSAPPLNRPYAKLGPPLFGPDEGFGPYGFVSAYDFPVQHQIPGAPAGTTYDGTGHAVGVVIDSDYLDSDLAGFLKYFNVTRTGPPTSRVLIDGGPKPVINGDTIETTLDVETVTGTAPGIKLYVYEPDELSYVAIIDTYNHAASDDKVDVVNSSFGGCETQTAPSFFPQLSDYIAEQAATEGMVFSASTGDGGTNACSSATPGGVSTPASGRHFVAAGGTTLFETGAGKYITEWGWAGSGGGVSAIFALPKYQSGVKNVLPGGRNLPDVGFDSDPDSGASYYLEGSWQGPIGGTSLASPLFCAMLAEVEQVKAKRIGGIHGALYGVFREYGYTGPNGKLFNDAVSVSNGYYTAIPGYDQVTGIGSIDGWNFAQLVK